MKVPPETCCSHCLQILCCSEHRLFHEMRRHGPHKRFFETPGNGTPYNFKKQQIHTDKRSNLKRKRTTILPNLKESSTNDDQMRDLTDESLACQLLEESQNSRSSVMQLEDSDSTTPNRYGVRENRDSFLMPLPPQPRKL